MKYLILTLTLFLLLVSCTPKKEIPPPKSEAPTPIIDEITPPPAPITVSPLSTEDFLTPTEKFSDERFFSPEFVMVHFISGVVLSKDDPYNTELVRSIFVNNEVSVHYVIERDGTILSYVPESRVAWHAGKGEFNEEERLTNAMNQYAIGIELVAIGSENDMAQYLTKNEYASLEKGLAGFTDAQYDSLKSLISDICERNSIPFDREHIIGHEEYSEAKTDPGELFDWDRLMK